MKRKRITCPYCGRDAVLASSKEVYDGRDFGMVWLCRPCGAWVGCHKNRPGFRPYGTLANEQLRTLRNAAHAAFDPIWKSGEMTRRDAYGWLATLMGLAVEACHVGMFDEQQCREVVEIVAERHATEARP